MVTVAIYIYINGIAKRVELFKDEKISVISSVQDVTDISKVFTDYSQSFTVPASRVNNAIFGYWYENSIEGGFDARIRKDAYIEIDSIFFRKGKIQLEKAQFKNGQVDNYSITFFGSLISLKDAFNNLSLMQFDYSELSFLYTGNAVEARVIGNVDSDIKFPLITSKNVWQYGGGGNVVTNWDISQSATPIYTVDLYPAIRVSKIFEIFEEQLGVTFEGDFLNDDRFKRLFLWLKNAEGQITIKSQPTLILYGYYDYVNPEIIESKFSVYQSKFNYDGGLVYNADGSLVYGGTPIVSSRIEIYFTTSGAPFTFSIYFNGVKVSSLDLTTSSTNTIYLYFEQGVGSYTYYISSANPITYTSTFFYNVNIVDYTTGDIVNNDLQISTNGPQSNNTNLDIANYMPDIKAEDLFSGILKMFNLTCYSDEPNIYKIALLEDWYSVGSFIDITKYVLDDTMSMDRVTTYKAVNFTHEKSESILNAAFKSSSVTEYGDLIYNIGVDGSDYTVKLPFENLLFNKFTGTDLQVGYCLKPDYKPYKPKPLIIYDYGIIQDAEFYLNIGGETVLENTYNCFGQDTNISDVNYTINWGVEQSTFTGSLETNTLFQNYYSTYIGNIFNQKARKITIKAILPLSILTTLKLNDRIIIRGKRYIINSFTTDLTTGIVDLDLLTDFRAL